MDVRKRLMEKEGLLKKKRGERKEEREGGSNKPEIKDIEKSIGFLFYFLLAF